MPSEHDEIPLLSQQEQDNDQEQGASTGPKPFSEDPARPSLHALSRPNSPPSYDEAVFSQSRSFLRRTLPAWARSARRALPDADSLRQFAGKAGGACVRYLPTNRFAQAAYFLVGLWLLFVLTRATLQAPGPVREYEDFVVSVAFLRGRTVPPLTCVCLLDLIAAGGCSIPTSYRRTHRLQRNLGLEELRVRRRASSLATDDLLHCRYLFLSQYPTLIRHH